MKVEQEGSFERIHQRLTGNDHIAIVYSDRISEQADQEGPVLGTAGSAPTGPPGCAIRPHDMRVAPQLSNCFLSQTRLLVTHTGATPCREKVSLLSPLGRASPVAAPSPSRSPSGLSPRLGGQQFVNRRSRSRFLSTDVETTGSSTGAAGLGGVASAPASISPMGLVRGDQPSDRPPSYFCAQWY